MRTILPSTLFFLLFPFFSNCQIGPWDWGYNIGNYGREEVFDMETDENGNSYLACRLNYDSEILIGTDTLSSPTSKMGLLKYDSLGNGIWGRIPGSGSLNGIDFDGAGNIIVLGYTDDSLTLLKYNTAGIEIWRRVIQGKMGFDPPSLSIDEYSNIYVGGNFEDSILFNSQTLMSTSETGFIAKFDSGGTEQWAYGMPSTLSAIACDQNGSFWVGGDIGWNQSFVLGGQTLSTGSYHNCFIAKYDSAGNLEKVRKYGDSSFQANIHSIECDKTGATYISGVYDGEGLFSGLTLEDLTINWEGFLLKLDTSGTEKWGKVFTGTITDINIGKKGYVFLSGRILQGNPSQLASTPFPVSPPYHQMHYACVLEPSGELVSIRSVSKNTGLGSFYTHVIASDQYGKMYVATTFSHTCEIDSTTTMSSSGNFDILLSRAEICYPPILEIPGNMDTLSICQGDSVLLSGQIDSSNSVQWLHNGIPISGAEDSTFFAHSGGSYSLTGFKDSLCPDTSRSIFIQINPSPFPLIEVVDGEPSFCAGGEEVIQVATSFSSYQWSTGDTGMTATLGFGGNIYLTVTDSLGCAGISDSLLIEESPIPVPQVVGSGSLGFCPGEGLNLYTSTVFSDYQWSTGDSVPIIFLSSPGFYSVMVTDSNGCEGLSDSVYISGFSEPNPLLVSSGPNAFCEGKSILLSTDLFYDTYLWSTGSMASTLTATNQGYYSVEVWDSNGCYGKSDSVFIEEWQSPTPEIIQTEACGLSTTDSSWLFYQWIMNGSILQGETGPSILSNDTGFYQLQVQDSFMCLGISDSIHLECIEVNRNDLQPDKLAIFPVPALDHIFVKKPEPIQGIIEVTIFSTNGKLLLSRRIDQDLNNPYISIDIEHLSRGLYFIQTSQNGKSYNGKFVVGSK